MGPDAGSFLFLIWVDTAVDKHADAHAHRTHSQNNTDDISHTGGDAFFKRVCYKLVLTMYSPK